MSRRVERMVSILVFGALLLSVGAAVWAQAPSQSQPGPTGSPGPIWHRQAHGWHPRRQAWRRHSYGRRRYGHPLIGTIASVSGTSLVLTTGRGRSIPIQTTPGTRVLSRRLPQLANLQAGDLARVLATPGPTGALSARMVSAIAPAAAPTLGRGGPALSRGGVWATGSGTVLIVGRLTTVPANGTVLIALPVGGSLRVTVPSTARLSRLASVPITGLSPATRVVVLGRPRARQGITATTILVVNAVHP